MEGVVRVQMALRDEIADWCEYEYAAALTVKRHVPQTSSLLRPEFVMPLPLSELHQECRLHLDIHPLEQHPQGR